MTPKAAPQNDPKAPKTLPPNPVSPVGRQGLGAGFGPYWEKMVLGAFKDAPVSVACPPDLAHIRALVKSRFGGGLTWFAATLPDGRVAGGKHIGGGVFGGLSDGR